MQSRNPSYRQENVIIHNRTQRYQAIPLPVREESIFNVSTARKSRVIPQSLCPSCGTRVAKQQVKACPYCDAELCPQCYQKAQDRMELDGEEVE